jgi:hypothetical protein
MNFVNQLSKVMPGNNVNPKGFIFVQGRMARQQNKSIFDCPFSIETEKSDIWMDGFQYEDKKINLVYIAGEQCIYNVQ